MFSKMSKSAIVGAAVVVGVGFGAPKAAADSFSVSVHTPGVSAGYSTHGRHDHGYVSVYPPAPRPVVVYQPAPVYAPPPVVVYRPVPRPVHVCHYDSRPVSRYRHDDCGRRVYYTEYVRVRTCDDYHRGHQRYADYDRGHRGNYGHGKHDYDKHDHGKHGRGNDRDHYARDWGRDDDDDRRGRHGRDDD
jgi:hypothetical protein